MPSKPVQRTISYYKAKGYIVGGVEKFNSFVGAMIKGKPVRCKHCNEMTDTFKNAGIRQDLFGFADLLVFHPHADPSVYLIQCGAVSDHASHKAKILDEKRAEQWCRFPNRKLILMSWGEYVPRNEDNSFKKDPKTGKRMKKEWTPRIEVFTSDHWGKADF